MARVINRKAVARRLVVVAMEVDEIRKRKQESKSRKLGRRQASRDKEAKSFARLSEMWPAVK